MADDFWIFIATWIPLTIVTGSVLLLILWLTDRKDRKPLTWLWSRESQANHPHK